MLAKTFLLRSNAAVTLGLVNPTVMGFASPTKKTG